MCWREEGWEAKLGIKLSALGVCQALAGTLTSSWKQVETSH